MANFELLNLHYADNLSDYYQKLAKLPGFVLLESGDRLRGRYDILSAYPYKQIIIKDNVSDISSVFDELQVSVPLRESSVDLPFQGGAIGYWSYDLGARFTNIHSLPQTSLQDMPLMNMGLYDWALIVDHHLKKVTLFSANTRQDTKSITEEVLSRWHKDNKQEAFKVRGSFTPVISEAEYQESFSIIHRELQRGRCYQVNYTQPFNVSYSGDSWSIYKQLKTKNPVPYSAFLHQEEADILSLSPEHFLTIDKGRVLTSPIKGTIRRSGNSIEDERLAMRLLASDKNRAENVMIVDLLRNDLGRIAKPGSVAVKSLCELQSFQAVHHLISKIEASCKANLSISDVFKACFPGGSITGAPKVEAMRIIAERERYARGIYCGSIVYFSRHGRFDSNIAIRTITARNNILHLAAGGGIVIDSSWEDEYRECFTKIAAIINGLK
ncbi:MULTISPECIES: aminodeoxychorismate synthase component I [unclassified Legionella]|uniref:aminodeoxychorismate synthase component I n=1 Tax=unclassified Legionella TaxID=2622702 RepID=UPI001055B3E6|nr:aminodeoxychorismate synthase component I [Legionella sp. W10-070]MDI9818904.1 aminodeoxychorismate synthase component I [Legionella sp. PL877]